MKKISATILDFGKPLFDVLTSDSSMEERRHAFHVVILIWNCLVLEELGEPQAMANLRASGESAPKDVQRYLSDAITKLAFRKKVRFPKTRLTIGEWELKDRGGGRVDFTAQGLGTAR
jgi:hypothetical protein